MRYRVYFNGGESLHAINDEPQIVELPVNGGEADPALFLVYERAGRLIKMPLSGVAYIEQDEPVSA